MAQFWLSLMFCYYIFQISLLSIYFLYKGVNISSFKATETQKQNSHGKWRWDTDTKLLGGHQMHLLGC
jgi:hypothetical protein